MVHRSSLVGPVFGLRREIDRLFEDTFGREGGRVGWAPAVDVREEESAVLVEVELPGIKPEDVEVTAENGVLTIRGEKQTVSKEGGEGRYHLVERTYGTFIRSFQLPANMDESGIEADFENGVLTVRVPKAAVPPTRRIQIRNSGSQAAIQGLGGGESGQRGSSTSSEAQRGGSMGSEIGTESVAGSSRGASGSGASSGTRTTGGTGTAGAGSRSGGGQTTGGPTTRGSGAQSGTSGRGSSTSGSSRTNTRGGR